MPDLEMWVARAFFVFSAIVLIAIALVGCAPSDQHVVTVKVGQSHSPTCSATVRVSHPVEDAELVAVAIAAMEEQCWSRRKECCR